MNSQTEFSRLLNKYDVKLAYYLTKFPKNQLKENDLSELLLDKQVLGLRITQNIRNIKITNLN